MFVRCPIGAHKVNEQSVYMETVYDKRERNCNMMKTCHHHVNTS